MAAELSPSSRRAFLATAQIRASKSVERNAAAMERKIREAAAAGADCVVFPEMALTGYFSDVVTAPGTPELCKAALMMIAAAEYLQKPTCRVKYQKGTLPTEYRRLGETIKCI